MSESHTMMLSRGSYIRLHNFDEELYIHMWKIETAVYTYDLWCHKFSLDKPQPCLNFWRVHEI